MKDKKGNVLVPVNGAQVGFRFSTWALKEASKERGFLSVSRFFAALSEDDTESIFCLFKHAYNEFNEVKIDDRGICDLVDDMGGYASALLIVADAIKQFDPNQTAPETGQAESEANTHLNNVSTSPVLN